MWDSICEYEQWAKANKISVVYSLTNMVGIFSTFQYAQNIYARKMIK